MSQKAFDGNRVIVGVSMSVAQRETIKAYDVQNDMNFSSAVRNLALEAMRQRQARELQAA